MKLIIITQKIDRTDENLGFFHRWVEEFAKYFSDIAVIAGAAGTFDFPSHVRVHSLGKERAVSKVARIAKFLKIFSRESFPGSAVFFHMLPEFALAASPFLLFRKNPSGLWYVHKSVSGRLRMAERVVDFVFTASEMSFRMSSKKTIYTGHAIDTDVFLPPSLPLFPRGGPRLLTLGRISPVKDLETVLQSCVILKERWPFGWTLSVVGGPLLPRDFSYLETLKTFVREKGLGDRVTFFGPRPYPEIPAVYRDHDIFLSMSGTGSLDKAILEAMASGLTVITGNEAFRDLLPAPYTVEKKSPEFLAERIMALAREARPNLALRDIVVRHHGLEHTIRRISETLKDYGERDRLHF
jgi:glycosyltransferase involved in cell wall biosynthesis